MLPRSSPAFVALLSALTTLSVAGKPTTYDYVIVGGGAVGVPLAVRLSEDPSKQVAILEAGNSGIGNPNITNLRLNRGNFGTENDWQFVTVPQEFAGNRPQPHISARVLGGGSAINSGMYLRGDKSEYDAFEKLGAKGWNWDTLFASVKKSERFMPPTAADSSFINATFNPEFHGTNGPVNLSVQALNISNFFPKYALPTLQNLGHAYNADPNGGERSGYAWDFLTATVDTNDRSYAVSGYYLPVQNRPNLHLLTSSHGARILWSNSTKAGANAVATGVEYLALNESADGSVVKTLNAKNVIVSSSAHSTPRFLELSGIGDPAVLKAAGVETKVELPGVGANFANQPLTTASFILKNDTGIDVGNAIRSAIIDCQKLSGFLNETEVAHAKSLLATKPELLSQSQYDVMMELLETVPHMEFAWNIAAANGTTTLTFDRIILLRPFSRGTVHINSTNPLESPVIDPKYLSVEFDKYIFAKAVQYTRKIADTEPLKSIIAAPGLPDATVQTDQDFVDYVTNLAVAEHHFVGTAAFTPKKDGGVVDSNLKVYGTKNVRVADLSIIPSIPGIHTVSLAYMVAETAAEVIKSSS